ncbi:hypothetical protein FB451DRAFT_1393875 [Mycena latifolia]|nr:hypothetical protein FB451DRAFT_1393875 [Mycena latifolia]
MPVQGQLDNLSLGSLKRRDMTFRHSELKYSGWHAATRPRICAALNSAALLPPFDQGRFCTLFPTFFFVKNAELIRTGRSHPQVRTAVAGARDCPRRVQCPDRAPTPTPSAHRQNKTPLTPGTHAADTSLALAWRIRVFAAGLPRSGTDTRPFPFPSRATSLSGSETPATPLTHTPQSITKALVACANHSQSTFPIAVGGFTTSESPASPQSGALIFRRFPRWRSPPDFGSAEARDSEAAQRPSYAGKPPLEHARVSSGARTPLHYIRPQFSNAHLILSLPAQFTSSS